MSRAVDHSDRPASGLDAIFSRRSTRSYTGERLNQPTIRALIDAAAQAPTALHLQPWAFAVVQDRAVLRRISDVARGLWNNGVDANHHGPRVSPDVSRFIEPLPDPAFSIFHDAGTLIVICAHPWGRFATADCWLAAGTLMLAAWTMGLGSCCIGSALDALDSEEIRSALDIPPDVVPVAPIIVGVPLPGAASQPSRRPPEILCWR